MGRVLSLTRPVLSTHQINPSEGRAKGLPPGIGGQAGAPSLETQGASASPTGPARAQPLHHKASSCPRVHSLCPPAWEPLPWPGTGFPPPPSRPLTWLPETTAALSGAVLGGGPGATRPKVCLTQRIPQTQANSLAVGGTGGPRSLRWAPRNCPDKNTLHGVDSALSCDPGGCTAQPTPASNLAGSRGLGKSSLGWGQGGGVHGPSPGTHPACFSYLGLRLDMDGPDRALGR